MTLATEVIEREVVGGTVKGMPPGHPGLPLAEIGDQGWSIVRGDLAFPVALLKQSAIDSNRDWMRRFLMRSGVLLAPHGKTTMSPQLFALQIEDGAWGITAATANQIAVYRRFGVQRILMANQLVGRANVTFLASELVLDPQFEFFTLVDSLASAELLASGAVAAGLYRGFNVLIEIGALGARTGVRNVEEGVKLARALKALAPYVKLRGIESYEGVFPDATPAERCDRSRALFSDMMALAEALEAEALFDEGPVIVTAGGTEFFDLAAEAMTARGGAERQYIIRSGCYLTHDDLAYKLSFERMLDRSPDLRTLAPTLLPSLEVWTVVQSRPEPTLALLTAGKRDISFDFDLPVAKSWSRNGTKPQALSDDHQCFRLNDQHAFLRIPTNSPLRVGDLVGLGVSHVCTTFDKWSLLFLVDDEYRVTGAIRTFF